VASDERNGTKRATGRAARQSATIPSTLDPRPSFSGLSKPTLALLAKLGIMRPFDLVLHLPLRYDDETRLYPIREAPMGQPVLVEGNVAKSGVQFRRSRQFVCQIEDGSGLLALRFFHFYSGLQARLAEGKRTRAFGEIRHGSGGPEMVHPKLLSADAPVARSLTPVYPTTAKLAQAELQRLIARSLVESNLADTLPPELPQRLKLPPFRDAMLLLHRPPPEVPQAELTERRHPAWRRVKFDELLAQQLSMRMHRLRRKTIRAPALRPRGKLAQTLLARLPFKLTPAQNKALAEIRGDLAQPHPMQRLLQGDVGSGKTIVAALAALQCVENGRQVAIMAPTEILAEQNHRKFSEWLGGLGIEVAWLSGSLAARQKREALARVAAGETAVVVGTHALIEDDVSFHDLGLAIIDEQQRFGVQQRLQLRRKGARANKGTQPHQLMMSATPIPRTLAMSYYADLDVSVIDGMPPGRGEVTTRLVRDSRRDEVTRRVRDACLEGGQAYWVCPLIEEYDAGGRSRADEAWSRGPVYGDATAESARGASDIGPSRAAGGQIPKGPSSAPRRAPLAGCDPEGGVIARSKSSELSGRARGRLEALQLKTALETHDRVRQMFPELKVGLVHGRLKGDEKSRVMADFKSGAIQLLVATTVIEVGVDAPSATLMVIENAERIGLAQLHQLRGRVGRGAEESTCILLYHEPLSADARERLKIIFEIRDGFEIANRDLEMRGPGEIIGRRQSGEPMLRFADLKADRDLLDAARAAAETLLREQPDAARAHVARWLGARHEYLKV
jgi:ATP-dependent DNA helicase RecG